MENTKPKLCKCGGKIELRIYGGVRKKTYLPKYCSRKCAYSLRVRPTGLNYNIVATNKAWFPKGHTLGVGVVKSEETLKKISLALKGKSISPNTEFKYTNGNGYRHLLYKGILSQECECGESNLQRLHVHHIDKNRNNNSLDNLKVLCRPCHLIEHNRVERSYVLGRKTTCKTI